VKASRKRTGDDGEEHACAELERRGYHIVERQWRCPRGEIDIVAQDGDVWAFVEVKTRHGHAAGLPEEALSRRKWLRIAEIAEFYLAEHELGMVDWRIDLVAIELGYGTDLPRINLLQGTEEPR